LNKSIKITEGSDGLQFIEIDNSLAVARVALQGGHVDWWRPKSVNQDVLWLSSNARYEKGRSIRGGVPICWPWFGKHPTDDSFCLHGFARVIPWKLLESSQLKNGATKIVLKMLPTEAVTKQLTYSFELILTIVVGETLYLNLKTTNLSDSPFVISEGYHTYFYISDIENIKVTGLEDSVYNDKIDNFARGVEKTPITFNNEFDRVYTNSNDCYIEDEKFNRVITIKKSNSNSTVVWTPWQKKSLAMGDMGKQDEWRRMVCVETANLLENSVVIYPKLSHSIATEYSVQEY
jgi:glucose-6-phosphate 1-epimerase|tara:strand:- start:5243 stop:6115 length:873 start_codon:yes stop_codon:yes gene_type:complete